MSRVGERANPAHSGDFSCNARERSWLVSVGLMLPTEKRQRLGMTAAEGRLALRTRLLSTAREHDRLCGRMALVAGFRAFFHDLRRLNQNVQAVCVCVCVCVCVFRCCCVPESP